MMAIVGSHIAVLGVCMWKPHEFLNHTSLLTKLLDKENFSYEECLPNLDCLPCFIDSVDSIFFDYYFTLLMRIELQSSKVLTLIRVLREVYSSAQKNQVHWSPYN